MSKRRRSLTPEQAIRQRRVRLADRQAAWALFRKAVILAAAFYVIFGILFGLTPMRGGDMQPRFAAGDLLFYYRLHDNYVRGDVIVFVQDHEKRVSRIVGMPGDQVDIRGDGSVIVNGNTLVETEIFYPTPLYDTSVTFPVTLGEDEYFVLGDHRDGARDSRVYGPVRTDELRGRVIVAIRRTDL